MNLVIGIVLQLQIEFLQLKIQKLRKMQESDKQNIFKQGKNIDDFPIKESERIITDVFCTLVGILFTLIIIIVALIVFNGDHYMRTSFPSDSEGRVCGYDLNSHPYIYFTKFPSITDRVCVQQCPKKGDTRLKCVPTQNIGCQFSDNPNFTVTYYQNQQQQIQIGSFCVPEQQSLKKNLYRDINVDNRYTFFNQISSIVTCAIISLGLSILYMVMVQFYSRIMNYVAVIAGLIFMLVLAIFTISYPTDYLAAKVIMGIVLLILISIVAYGAFKSKYCFDMHGLFLQSSAQLVKENVKILILIPLFLVFLVLFIVIIIWQFKSFWSSSTIYFNSDSVYYSFTTGQTAFSTFVIFFQCLWGLSFIKQTFNYCVSANAVRWYDDEKTKQEGEWSIFKPFKYIFFYNFGSIVAASFMSLIFSLFDYIFDVLRGGKKNRRSNTSSFFSFIDNFFDLVRSDSMAYINLSGNPYCNASRYCQILCQRSPISQYSQSISRSYRICSHFLIAGLVSTLSFFLQGAQSSIFIVAIVFTLSIFISTFFISIHADAAEAIQIIFLLDVEFAKKKQQGEMNLHNLTLRNPSFAKKYINQTDKIVSKHRELNAQLIK